MIFFGIFIVNLVVAAVAFAKLPLTFFQQDEWAIFGNYLYWDKTGLNWWERLFIYEQYTHIIPFGNLVSYALFKLFGLNFFGYGVFNIGLHVVNSLLVYILAEILLKKKVVSLLAGFLFLISSIPHQAITWAATTVGTAGSTFFVLLTLIFFFMYLKRKQYKYMIFSAVSLVCSLGFKETSVFLFLFLPIAWTIYNGLSKVRSAIFSFSPFVVFGFFYIFLRAYLLFFGYETTSSPQAIAQPHLAVYAYRAFATPLKFVAQMVVPQEYILGISNTLVALGYPHLFQGGVPNPYIVGSVGADIVSYAASVLIIVVSFLFYLYFKRKKEIRFSKTILISLLFIYLSALPFVMIPGPAGFFSLVDGRHLYSTNIFTAILLALLVWGIFNMVKNKKVVLWTLVFLFFVYSFGNIVKVRRDINQQVGTAFIRTQILEGMYRMYPTLPQKVIIYTESDKPYYGLPQTEKIFPFQSGFGQTLLVWYNARGENFPACFFRDQFLYVLLSEGYRECGGRGFGYFRKPETFKVAVKDNNLSVENIIGLRYNSSTHGLLDITNKIKLSLKQ